MLDYDRIDISEGIDVDKINASKECDICHSWYFEDIGLNHKYEPYLTNCCHDLMQKAMSFNDAISYCLCLRKCLQNSHFVYEQK